MKYVVFSDIHGNIAALNKMLKETISMDVQGYIFCGDIVGYFLHTEEVILELKKISNLYAIMGNHDLNYLLALNNGKRRRMLAEKYGNSYLANISKEALSFLNNLPEKREVIISNRKILILHGTMEDSVEGRMYPDTPIVNEEIYKRYELVLCGHSHYRLFRKIGETLLINPGSLGQPRDGEGFSYCIVDMLTLCCEYKKVEIDKEELKKETILFEKHDNVKNYLVKRLS